MKIKNIIFILSLVFSLTSTVAAMEQIQTPQAASQYPARPVIMIIENRRIDVPVLNNSSDITFEKALDQKHAAIIVSSQIVYSYLEKYVSQVAYGQKGFANWTVFDCKNANALLFIPNANYETLISGFNQKQLTKIELGNPTDYVKLKTDIFQAVGPYVFFKKIAKKRGWSESIYNQLSSINAMLLSSFPLTELLKIFIKGSGSWLFLKLGHGIYTFEPFRNGGWLSYINPIDCSAISGIWKKQNMDFLEFAGKKINTFAIVETTCFGGGYNANEILKHIKMLEQDTQFKSFFYCITNATDASCKGFTDFHNFFSTLFSYNKSFSLPGLIQALKFDIKKLNNDLNSPMLFYCPENRTYDLLVEPSALVLKKTTGNTYSFYKRLQSGLFISNEIFISSDNINSNLKFGHRTMPIVSLLPGDKVCKIKRISTIRCLEQLLNKSFFQLKEEAATKYYLVHELKCQRLKTADSTGSSLILENVIICKSYLLPKIFGGQPSLPSHNTAWIKIKNEEKYYKMEFSPESKLSETSKHEYNAVLEMIKKQLADQRAVTSKSTYTIYDKFNGTLWNMINQLAFNSTELTPEQNQQLDEIEMEVNSIGYVNDPVKNITDKINQIRQLDLITKLRMIEIGISNKPDSYESIHTQLEEIHTKTMMLPKDLRATILDKLNKNKQNALIAEFENKIIPGISRLDEPESYNPKLEKIIAQITELDLSQEIKTKIINTYNFAKLVITLYQIWRIILTDRKKWTPKLKHQLEEISTRINHFNQSEYLQISDDALRGIKSLFAGCLEQIERANLA